MWSVTESPVGRIVVPPDLPSGFALFCTTADFHGALDANSTGALLETVRQHFGIEATLTTCTQVHGATVTRAVRERSWRECDSCDALFSDARNVALGIKVADCLPVTMLDPRHSVVANVHSGWRGAVQRITAATLDSLERDTAFDAAESHAYLGPTIRVCCFEVGEDVAARFGAAYVDRSHEKPHVDLAAFTRDVLRERGFDDARIHDSRLCTRCEGSMFHSFRRDGSGGGRNLAIVAQ